DRSSGLMLRVAAVTRNAPEILGVAPWERGTTTGAPCRHQRRSGTPEDNRRPLGSRLRGAPGRVFPQSRAFPDCSLSPRLPWPLSPRPRSSNRYRSPLLGWCAPGHGRAATIATRRDHPVVPESRRTYRIPERDRGSRFLASGVSGSQSYQKSGGMIDKINVSAQEIISRHRMKVVWSDPKVLNVVSGSGRTDPHGAPERHPQVGLIGQGLKRRPAILSKVTSKLLVGSHIGAPAAGGP